jgi:predicted ATPase/class 3 adenylate cyclase
VLDLLPCGNHTDAMAETVAFLFSDVEGSTRLLSAVGAQRYGDVLSAYRAAVEDAATAAGGAVADREGDGLFLVFPTAAAALTAALGAQRAIGETAWPEGISVRARMGVHAGEAERHGDGWVGLAVHRAARVASAAHGGQVLLSEAARALAADDLPQGAGLLDLGEHRLKDLGRAEHLYQLTAPQLPADFPPLQTLDVVPHNLPLQPSSFIGREEEQRKVMQLLASERLVTLTGAGGAGKSRLALQAAAEMLDQHSDGVWLVELAPLTDPDGVVGLVAAMLGIREDGSSGAGSPTTLRERLIEHLGRRSVLLILDNCEHLLDEVSSVADALLRACQRVRILATSREGLGLAGETIWRVPSLRLPDESGEDSDAVKLFADRARAVTPTFALTPATLPAVIQICRRLDGMPLAIELAAARVRVLAVDQLAARLDDSFRLLTGGSRTALPRQQTLEAAIDWSYQLLSDAERALFARLSVFAGGFTLEAAEEIGAGGIISDRDVMDLVFHLADKSLVGTLEGPAGPTRYRMLETLRQYARLRLAEAGEGEAVRDRHLARYARLAQQGRAELTGPERVAWLDELELEHDNLRAALDWALGRGAGAEAALLATALARHSSNRGQYRRGIDYARTALDHLPTDAEPAWEADIRFHLSANLGSIGDADAGLTEIERACELVRGIGPSPIRARVLARYANLLVGHVRHAPTEAIGPAREAVDDAQSLGSAALLAYTLRSLGNALARAGQIDASVEYLRQALDLARQADDHYEIAATYSSLFVTLHDLGHREAEADALLADIRAWLETTERASYGRLPILLTRSFSLWALITYHYLRRGDWPEVERLLEPLDRLQLEDFDRAFLLQVRGALRWMQGRLVEAWADAREMRDLRIERWNHDLFPLLAEIAASGGRLSEARAAADEYLAQQVDPTEESMKVAVLSPLVRAEVDAALHGAGGDREAHLARARAAVQQARDLVSRFPPASTGAIQFEAPAIHVLLAQAELSRAGDGQPDLWRRLIDEAWYAYTRLYARMRLAEALLAGGNLDEGRRELEAAHREAQQRGAQLIAHHSAAIAARWRIDLDH